MSQKERETVHNSAAGKIARPRKEIICGAHEVEGPNKVWWKKKNPCQYHGAEQLKISES